MRLSETTSSPASPSVLVGSYIAELKRWAARIAAGYAVATVILLAGAFSIAVAVGIGFAALFHWLETRYGAYVAYGAVGGMFLLAGILGVIVGLQWLKRPTPSVPRPRRQIRALRNAVAVPAVSRALTAVYAGNSARPDRVTQALAGAAAVALLGWIVASHVPRSSRADRDAT